MLEINLTILKFDDIIKRRDIKNPTWFALENDFFSHPDFFKLTPQEIVCWIWILCVASKVNCAELRLDSEVFSHQAKVKEDVFHSTIEKLNGKRISVQIRTDPSRVRHGSVHYSTVQYSTEQDTTVQNKTEHDTLGQNSTEQNSTLVVQAKEISTRTSKAGSRGCIIEFSDDGVCRDFLSNVTDKAQRSWLKAYPSVDWIKHEIRKANAWCETNSTKAPKDRGKFMLNWLNRGFEEYRKTIKSQHTGYDPNAALREKLEREERFVHEKKTV